VRRIRKRPAAKQDLDRQADYLGRASGNPELESKFLDAVADTFKNIRDMPTMGSPVTLPRLAEHAIRKWPVQDFPGILIFYREIDNSIEVLRVLHGRQDWQLLLKAQF
jgi:toxin ParE1/3/4